MMGFYVFYLYFTLYVSVTCGDILEAKTVPEPYFETDVVDEDLEINFGTSSAVLEANETTFINIYFNIFSGENFTFEFNYRDMNGNYLNDSSRIPIDPLPAFTLSNSSVQPFVVTLVGRRPGRIELGLSTNSTRWPSLNLLHLHVSVVRYHELQVFQTVIGWGYFIAWTVSFYPQAYLNWRRKSVVGLSFDFLAFNLLGFICYSAFNIGLYWIPYIQNEYNKIHPVGVLPVELNDIFFSLHAVGIVTVEILQCAIYERGSQRVSIVCWIILSIMLAFITISSVLAGVGTITWLTCLYFISYVKLAVTLLKFTPQAIFNCRRRSTEGWSIGQIICDFIGGVLSILQMIVIAYNSDDWTSLWGSPTKLGLALFSIGFDFLFFGQHYICYRETPAVIVVEVSAPSGQPASEEGHGVLDTGHVDTTEETHLLDHTVA
ncbi:hypothetical protein SprV_0602214500 [Sparganum proliferum]